MHNVHNTHNVHVMCAHLTNLTNVFFSNSSIIIPCFLIFGEMATGTGILTSNCDVQWSNVQYFYCRSGNYLLKLCEYYVEVSQETFVCTKLCISEPSVL
jgi:hypothetical protein